MNDRNNRDDHLFLWFACLIILFIVVPMMYAAYFEKINGPLLALARAQIRAFTPFFEEARTAWARISEADLALLSWDTMQKVLIYTGSWIRWPFALLLGHAVYEMPWFMALLNRARRKGVLSSSQFLWIRPLDRPLWYALNQCGGRAAWAEGFAPWAHYTAEEKKGRPYLNPTSLPPWQASRKPSPLRAG